MTVEAVANPHNMHKEPKVLHNRAVGYGIVTFNKKDRTIKTDCYQRFADPLAEGAQYPGWPQLISQEANYSRKAKAYLPEIKVNGIANPVIQIKNEKTGVLVYTPRMLNNIFKPKIFDDAVTYTVKIGEPDKNLWQETKAVKVDGNELVFNF